MSGCLIKTAAKNYHIAGSQSIRSLVVKPVHAGSHASHIIGLYTCVTAKSNYRLLLSRHYKSKCLTTNFIFALRMTRASTSG